jgi:hypothetical protein
MKLLILLLLVVSCKTSTEVEGEVARESSVECSSGSEPYIEYSVYGGTNPIARKPKIDYKSKSIRVSCQGDVAKDCKEICKEVVSR